MILARHTKSIIGLTFVLLNAWVFASLPAHSQTIELISPHQETLGQFGASVSGIPDVTGDGHGDVVVGAPGENPEASPEDAGRAYLLDGVSGLWLRTIQSPNEETYGRFGLAVTGVSDVNGDGRGDALVGAPGESPGASPTEAGRAYLYDGATGALLRPLVSPNEEAFGLFGYSVSEVPDTNGDGRADIVVGAPGESPGASPDGSGRAYIFDGSSGLHLHTLFSPNEEEFGLFGFSVSGLADTDGDGLGDVLVGAPDENPGTSPEDAGRAYLFDGAGGSLLQTFASPNQESFGAFGRTVSGVPDTNGDSYSDAVVGAEGEALGAGRAYLFDGSTSVLLHGLTSPNETMGGAFGGSIAGVPDITSDGRGDVLVGAYNESSAGALDFDGVVYLFGGSTGLQVRPFVSLNGRFGGLFGRSVSGIASPLDDRLEKILVGAMWEGASPNPDQAGRVYLFQGESPSAVKYWRFYDR